MLAPRPVLLPFSFSLLPSEGALASRRLLRRDDDRADDARDLVDLAEQVCDAGLGDDGGGDDQAQPVVGLAGLFERDRVLAREVGPALPRLGLLDVRADRCPGPQQLPREDAAGARLLVDTLPSLLDGTVRAVPQVDAEATYAPNLRREDEWIDWNRTSRQIYNQVRGLRPWPVAYTTWNGEVLKIWEARRPDPSGKAAPQAEGAPGTVVRAGGDGIEVRTGDGTLLLTVVQPAGKRPMPAGDFVRGGRIAPGTVLGGDRP